MNGLKKQAQASGYTLLGTIHSHPDCENWPSEADNVGARESGEHVFGILKVLKKGRSRARTDVKWWLTQHPLQNVVLR